MLNSPVDVLDAIVDAVFAPPPDTLTYDNPADFIEQELYIPETGAPMQLHPEQRAVLEAMAVRAAGKFLFSTWLFSMPKKSAKTTIGAGVALWQAWRVPDGEIYIIGNDLKQADNRMAQAIRYCVEHNPRMRQRVTVTTSKYTIRLDNGTKIESIPVDPRGEAGMNPTGLFWTEAWGAKGSRAKLLWTEAALSPTRAGDSFKFVESYAGFNGESEVLELLYEGVVKNGQPHPVVPELYTNGASIAYWCTRRYLPWQTSESGQAYYRQEAIEKPPSEFDRIHNNKWSSASEAFVPVEWWDACRVEPLPPLRPGQGLVLALDAAVDSDCFGIVGVSKDTGRHGQTIPTVRYVRKWTPPTGGKIRFSNPHDPDDRETPEGELRHLCRSHRIECIAYDPYQLEEFAQRLSDLAFFEAFNQNAPRLVADKQLYDVIREARIQHGGDPDLRDHIQNANRKPDGDKLRIVKRTTALKIDLCVALSMAVDRVLYYNL